MGLAEFLRDCGVGNCSYHIVFFFYQLLSWEEKTKKILFSKKLQKAGRPCDQIRDRLFYELVDEI